MKYTMQQLSANFSCIKHGIPQNYAQSGIKPITGIGNQQSAIGKMVIGAMEKLITDYRGITAMIE